MLYYDWHKTLSYAADVTLVIAARGRGKTYGLRKQCIRDFIKRGYTFVEVCRYKSEVNPIMDGYFSRLELEFEGYIFKAEKQKGYIAPKPENEKEKPNWSILCYFLALTDAQNAKKRTYNNVKNIIFDEAILEHHDRHHRYIPREYTKLANIVDTVTRERPESNVKPHLFLLGNAVDLSNAYFNMYGINRMPKFGYHWYRNKTVLLHYEDPGQYAEDKLEQTLSGRMISGTSEADTAARNVFESNADTMIVRKPARAKFELGFKDAGQNIGVWADYTEGYYYVTGKIPEGTDRPVYYVTREDASANLLAARRADSWMKTLSEAHYSNLIRYETLSMLHRFLDMLAKFGLA